MKCILGFNKVYAKCWGLTVTSFKFTDRTGLFMIIPIDQEINRSPDWNKSIAKYTWNYTETREIGWRLGYLSIVILDHNMPSPCLQSFHYWTVEIVRYQTVYINVNVQHIYWAPLNPVTEPLTQSQRRCMQSSWILFPRHMRICQMMPLEPCGRTQLFRLQPSVDYTCPVTAFMFSCSSTQCTTPEGWKLGKALCSDWSLIVY